MHFKKLSSILFIILCALTSSGQSKNNHSKNKKANMSDHDFTTSFLVDQTPQEVFNAVNNVRGWWSEQIEGSTDRPDAIFNYHYRDVHICKMKIIVFEPGKKVIWKVLENHFNFIKDQAEWVDTEIVFDISVKGNKTQLRFTHVGLVPAYECYKICHDAWSNYINTSLRSLIETGKGNPNPYEPAIKSAEALQKNNQ